MKVLLLGKTGLLGSAVLSVLQKNSQLFEVAAPTHDECDVTDPENLSKYIETCAPDCIMNCVGYTNVDGAEKNEEQAFLLNVDVVETLAEIITAQKKQTALVHFSSDYVFDGETQHRYIETAPTNPLSVYGNSKALAEKIIHTKLKNYFIVRTAWLYGPNGKNFVDTMIELAHTNNGKPINVVNDQFGSPTFTSDLAHALLPLLQSKSYGMYHIVNEGSCSWYELAVEIFNQLGVPQKINAVSTREFARPAKRPKFSALKNTKLPHLRPWKEALGAYLINKTVIL